MTWAGEGCCVRSLGRGMVDGSSLEMARCGLEWNERVEGKLRDGRQAMRDEEGKSQHVLSLNAAIGTIYAFSPRLYVTQRRQPTLDDKHSTTEKHHARYLGILMTEASSDPNLISRRIS